jgi:hypothetical protein
MFAAPAKPLRYMDVISHIIQVSMILLRKSGNSSHSAVLIQIRVRLASVPTAWRVLRLWVEGRCEYIE